MLTKLISNTKSLRLHSLT